MGKAAFLDRDGVINRKAKPGEYVTRWEEMHILPGVAASITLLNQAGFLGDGREQSTLRGKRTHHNCRSRCDASANVRPSGVLWRDDRFNLLLSSRSHPLAIAESQLQACYWRRHASITLICRNPG